MNHTFNVVWNATLGAWVPVPEAVTGSRGKARGRRRHAVAGRVAAVPAAVLLLVAPPALAQVAADALPTGGAIVSGTGSISQSGTAMTVVQDSARMVADWSSFNIGQDASVAFQQPDASAMALNRVAGGVSHIFGRLSANGQVLLVNPNGVVFGPNSQVDVGSLVTSTLGLATADFEAGRLRFSGAAGAGSIVNQGALSAAPGGVIALIAPQVANHGTINTPEGSAVLAAGTGVTLDFVGDGLVQVTVDQAAFDALVDNQGAVVADGGMVAMSAAGATALMDTVINTDGVVRANTLGERNGRIVLDGGASGSVQVAGTVQATGAEAGQNGGAIDVTGAHVTVAADAVVEASGAAGGGDIRIGGGYQGNEADIHNATTLTMEDGATVSASALEAGDGGRVILWADDTAHVAGTITARGGAQGGDGGFVETSGKKTLTMGALWVNAGASQGQAGLWLIDPEDITVDAAMATTIEDGLTNNDVLMTTNAGEAGNGDITIHSAINSTTTNALTFRAHRNIALNSDITTQGGAVTLAANSEGVANGGSVALNNASISTNGGHIVIGGGADGSSAAQGHASGATGVTISGSTLDAGAGDVTVRGQGFSVPEISADNYGGTVAATGTAGIGVVTEGTSSITGATVVVEGTGGHGGDAVNTAAEGPPLLNTGETGAQTDSRAVANDGNYGIHIKAGAISINGTTSASLTAIGGKGGTATATNLGGEATAGSGATGWFQEGDIAFNAPTATIDGRQGAAGGAEASYRSEFYNDLLGTWSTGTSSNTTAGAPGDYGIRTAGSISNTTGNTLRLLTTGHARQEEGVTLTATNVLMDGGSNWDFDFRRDNNNNVGTLAARANILAFRDAEDLVVGTVAGVSGIVTSRSTFIQVDSKSPGAEAAFIQASGDTPLSFGTLRGVLTADSMHFNGDANTVTGGSVILRPLTDARDIVLGGTVDPGNALFLNDNAMSTFNPGSLYIGGSNKTGTMTVNDISLPSTRLALTMGSGDITIAGTLTLGTNQSLGLFSDGTVNAADGVIKAQNVRLKGDGTFLLTNPENSIQGLGAQVKVLEVMNTGMLSLTNINTHWVNDNRAWDHINPLTSAGAADVTAERMYINTTSDLRVNRSVTGTRAYDSTVPDNPTDMNDRMRAAVVLVSGRDFIGNTRTISAPDSRWLIYSRTPEVNNHGINAASGDAAKMYAWQFHDADADTYNNDISTNNLDRDWSDTGNWHLYSHQPTLTVTPNGETSIYGNAITAPTDFVTAGWIGGDTDALLTGTATISTAASATAPVGKYEVAYTGGLSVVQDDVVLGYNVVNNTQQPGEWTIAPRPITLTPDAGTTKIYGNADPGLPTYTVSYTGGGHTALVNGDTLSGAMSRAAGEDVATYQFTQGTLSAGSNYDITWDGASHALAITPRPITVTPDTGTTKLYGDADPALTYAVAYTGGGHQALVNGDALSGALSRAAGEDVGSYTISQGGLNNSNYAITWDNAADARLAITPRPITVTPNAGQAKIYGDHDPTLAYGAAFTGDDSRDALVFGDTLTGALARAAGENVGTYQVNQGTLSAGTNYSVTWNGAGRGLTITPRPVTVTPDTSHSRIYGNADPTFTYSVAYTGDDSRAALVGGDALTGALNRAVGEDVGSYLISQGSLSHGNYAVTWSNPADHSLTITPRPITLTPNAGQTRIYGEADPTLTYAVAYTGDSSQAALVRGDALTGALTRAAGEDVGTYLLSQGTLGHDNYAITWSNAAARGLTVSPRPITVRPSAGQEKIAGQDDPRFLHGLSFTGDPARPALVRGDTEGTVLTGNLARDPGEAPSDYAYTLGTLTASTNYALSFSTEGRVFTIRPNIDLSSLTSVQTGITGTGAATSSPAARQMGPGTGSTSLAATANTQVVTNLVAPQAPSTQAPPLQAAPAQAAPQAMSLATGTGSAPLTVSRSGGVTTVTMSGGPDTTAGTTAGNAPTEAGLTLFTASTSGTQPTQAHGAYTVTQSGQSLSATTSGAAQAALPAARDMVEPPVSAALEVPGGGSVPMSVGVSTDGVLVIEVPADAAQSVDPETTMLLGLAVARQSFGDAAAAIGTVLIRPAQ